MRLPGSQSTVPLLHRTRGGADKAVMAQLPAEVQARVAEEDEALFEAEAQLPGGDDEIHWSDIETDSSEDDEYFPPAPATHDHEAGGSREPAEPAVTTVSQS